jgi:hypothetical protein
MSIFPGWPALRAWVIVPGVNDNLRELLATGSGVVTRSEALAVAPAHMLNYALLTGQLVRLHRAVYADPQRLDRRTRLRAAVRYGQERAALSHLSALEVLGLRAGEAEEPIHLTTAPATAFAGTGLVVHRARGFVMSPPGVLVRQGLPVTSLERSVVDSWPLLPPEDRRAPVIRAVTDRRTTPGRLRATLDTRPRLADRTTLGRVLHLSTSNSTGGTVIRAPRIANGTCAGTPPSPPGASSSCGSPMAGSCPRRRPYAARAWPSSTRAGSHASPVAGSIGAHEDGGHG